MKNVPKVIYLQTGNEDIQPDEDFNSLTEVSWCADKIFPTDIEYVLKEAAQSMPNPKVYSYTFEDIENALFEYYTKQDLANADSKAHSIVWLLKNDSQSIPKEEATRSIDTLYTYFQVEIKDSSLEWDITICETLDEVRDILQLVEIDLDDEERKTEVVITGIPMTKGAYNDWRKEFFDNP